MSRDFYYYHKKALNRCSLSFYIELKGLEFFMVRSLKNTAPKSDPEKAREFTMTCKTMKTKDILKSFTDKNQIEALLFFKIFNHLASCPQCVHMIASHADEVQNHGPI
jgi:hypothetical protein